MGELERRRQRRIKDQVINRDGLVCCYCDKILTLDSVTMEHIVPESKRGTYNTTNLTVSCFTCNNNRGSINFFTYCKAFNFSEHKLAKYKKLYFNNLKIKILNIAKEECLISSHMVPLQIIHQACQILRIADLDFSQYEKTYQFEINFSQPCERKKIKFSFEQLIRIIESETF